MPRVSTRQGGQQRLTFGLFLQLIRSLNVDSSDLSRGFSATGNRCVMHGASGNPLDHCQLQIASQRNVRCLPGIGSHRTVVFPPAARAGTPEASVIVNSAQIGK